MMGPSLGKLVSVWQSPIGTRAGSHPRRMRKTRCVLAILFIARVAIAQNAQGTVLRTSATEAPATATGPPAPIASAGPTAEKIPAVSPKISYVGGQLSIHALDSTLVDVLARVAVLTDVKIDVPAGAGTDRMPVVELGPGPARQILASLLSDSDLDYLIQASDNDPEKIQSVLLIPREKRSSGAVGTDAAARPSRSPYARAAAFSEQVPAPDSPVAVQPMNAAAEASSSNPPPVSTQPEQSTPSPPAPPDQTMQLPLSQAEQSNLTRPGALTPPQVLSPQSINQQLQQMYQQRMEMIQQNRQAVPPATAKPGSK